MKLSDYVFQYFSSVGVRHVFTLTGGGIMHLVDSMGRSGMKYVCCHHEQAAAIAAQAYSMLDERLSVCLATTGPGGTNALTGAAAAYMDSTPVIYLTGQVKREDFAVLRGVRQYGAQENDILSMARPIVKYAVGIMDPERIAYELERCVYIATHGRKGPVWIDIPLDVQAAEIDETSLTHFQAPEEPGHDIHAAVETAFRLLAEAKRPLLLLGQGALSSGAEDSLHEFVDKTGIPVMATWRALSFMGTAEEGFFGSPGLQAPRYSNFILQSADFLLVLGSRLDNMITAFNEEHFAPLAKKVIVDIDEKELEKLHMRETFSVHADIARFISGLLGMVKKSAVPFDFGAWQTRCQKIKARFSLFAERQATKDGVDLYQAVKSISEQTPSDDVLAISSTSRCNTAGHIAFLRQRGQKSVSSMGFGSMGFALPSAVGAYFASKERRVIMLEGDGSLQLNLQELQTIVSYNINAKMFIFSNRGYAAITAMQDRNFDGFYVGSNEKSGVFMPDLEKIAAAYGIPYRKITKDEEIAQAVRDTLAEAGAAICDIQGGLSFDEIPKCISHIDPATGKRVSAHLEDAYPFLPETTRKEVMAYLIEGTERI
ncbi:MAG: thiamine pyrophosphate-binding protein [Selenomonadaceae bacterium]|nr:thiamine pyrophosphate-binding protein [Selenomonadaceae bacterium]